DGVFFLDWEAFPNREVQIAAPQFKVLDGETRIELGKNLLNTTYYDLTYAVENHFIVQVTPADSRDLPIHENSRVFMFGNQHQTVVYGDVYPSPDDPKVMETTITFTPTGLNEAIAHLGFYNKNKNYLTPPYDLKNTSTYTLMNLVPFDASLGLHIEVLTEGPVYVLKDNVLTVRVKEVGTKAPVEGATVAIKGPGVSGSKVTNASGIATFDITASETGFILVEATKEGRIIGRDQVQVRESNDQPFIEIDPLPPCTNQPNVQITGITNPGNTVTLNGSIKATVNADGSWSSPFTLKEGMNTIIAEARNAKGASAKASITTILDTIPSEIFIDNPGELIDITELTITGRVEPDSQKVTVNGIEAEIVHDIFKAHHVPVKLGPNTFTVHAIDQAGNASSVEATFYVYHEVIIQLTIGNPEVTIDGETQDRLSFPPYISRGRTMVPLRVITEAFGAVIGWDGPSKTVTITMGDLEIKMTIDHPIALVNGVETQLDAPPEIREGSTFVPISFIATTVGAVVEWDAGTQTATIRYKK
ncbi:MAG: stalk domain-containing protein, partial [Caldisericia bacterium]|nr:stalk domain-containing protein [Caldisericia bacterium]